MSIANEITRLNTAKADMKTSIENKGVVVSPSAKIDAYAALINSIPTDSTDTTHIVAVYNIDSAGSTSIINNAGLDYIAATMEVDGSTVSTATTYNFTSAGQHTVKFTPTGTAIYQLFIDISSLVSVSFPEGLIEVGSQTCAYCSNLTKVVFSSTITTIGTSCFESCTSLTELKLPASITSIQSEALSYCEALESIYYYGNTLPTNQGSNHMTYEGGTVYVKAGVSTSPWETGSYNIITYWGYSVGYITEIKKDNYPIVGVSTRTITPTSGKEGISRLVAKGIGRPDSEYDILIRAKFNGSSVSAINSTISSVVYVDDVAHTISNGYSWPNVTDGYHWVGLNCALSNKAISIAGNSPFSGYYGFSPVEIYFLKVTSITGNGNTDCFTKWRAYDQTGVRNPITGNDPFLLYISNSMNSMSNLFPTGDSLGMNSVQRLFIAATALIIEDGTTTLSMSGITFGNDEFLRYVYIGRNLEITSVSGFGNVFSYLMLDELSFGPNVTRIGNSSGTFYDFYNTTWNRVYCYASTPPSVTSDSFKGSMYISSGEGLFSGASSGYRTGRQFYYPSGADYSSWIGSGTSYVIDTRYATANAIL